MAHKKIKVNEEENDQAIINLKGQLARALADYDNLRKRTEAERESWLKVSSIRVIGKLLPTLDMLGAAQKHLNDQGLAIVLGEFRKVVEEEGVEEIKIEEGKSEFNSAEMEVIEVIETDDPNLKGKVAEVLMAGWKLKKTGEEEGFIIRPAKVKVYK